MKKLNVVIWLLSVMALLGSVGYFYRSHQNHSQTKYVIMHGGLGNQIRQYMFGAYLKDEFKYDVKFVLLLDGKGAMKYSLWPYAMSHKMNFASIDVLDNSNLETNISEPSDIINNPLLPLKFRQLLKNKAPEFKKISNDIDVYYFPAPFFTPYFTDRHKDFLKDFTLQIPLNDANKAMLEKIKSCNSVLLHIKASILKDDRSKTRGLKAYYKAIDEMAKKIKSPHFFVFSDDIEWSKKNLELKHPHTFVNINDTDEGYFDLELMRNCKHAICDGIFTNVACDLSQSQTPDRVVSSVCIEGEIN